MLPSLMRRVILNSDPYNETSLIGWLPWGPDARRRQHDRRVNRNIEQVILGILSRNEQMTGLDLVYARPDRLFRGTIYMHLERMRDKGLVGYVSLHRFDDIIRNYYYITDAGRDAVTGDTL